MSCCSAPNTTQEASANPICPSCRQRGQSVDQITPKQTLKKDFRSEVSAEATYFFCENPSCNVVYFNDDGGQLFTTKQLINRVTCKDSSPDTPLCYCFKITKGDVRKEYRESQQSSILEMIEQKMAEKACFCDKSNPRGVCCTTEIKNWLMDQGIAQCESSSTEPESCCGSSCC